MDQRRGPGSLARNAERAGARLVEGGSADVVTSTVRDVTGQEPRSFETFARDYSSAFQPPDETAGPAAPAEARPTTPSR